MRFEWDEAKATANLKKHGVSFPEATFAFDDPAAVEIYDLKHSQREDRFILIGITVKGVLIVVHTFREHGTVRLINARKASRKERRLYYDQEKKD